MPKTTPAQATPLRDQLETLAAIEPQAFPFLSLYLDLRPNQHGRDEYDVFIRKAFAEREKAFRPHTPERESFDRDVERINSFLPDIDRSANGLAIFACAGADDFFEAVQLDAPLEAHWLFVGPVPHLYPLAQAADRFPRFAAVITDTFRARIFVFSLGAIQSTRKIVGQKTHRSSAGGWSQARYQRRADNVHLHHAKEVADALDRIVTAENIQHVIIAGDAVAVPLVKSELAPHLTAKVVDVFKLDADASEDQLLRKALDALQKKEAETDAELVEEAVGGWQAHGLGTVGPDATMRALTMGQVDQLLITGRPQDLKPAREAPPDSLPGEITAETSLPAGPADPARLKLAAELVARAEQTGARIRFVEDPDLLKNYGGVAAILRFRA
jgi:peptide subunit release factor 1 (eRF1)